MAITIIIFQLILAAVLLLLINRIGKLSRRAFGYVNLADIAESNLFGYNLFVRVLAPSVIITVVVIFLYLIEAQRFIENIWLSVIWYSALLTLFLFSSNRIFIINLPLYLLLQVGSILLAFGFYQYIWIHGLAAILPDGANFRTELWVLLLLFSYSLLNGYQPNYFKDEERKNRFYIKRFFYFEHQYSKYLKTELAENLELRRLFFCIMIVEDFNRGPVSRFIERILHPLGLAKSTGLMQITHERPLTDKESIEIAQEKILAAYAKHAKSEPWERIRSICVDYNPDIDYFSSVFSVFEAVSRAER